VIGADLVATADYVIDVLADAKIGTLTGPTVEFVVADAVGAPASGAFKLTEVAPSCQPPHRGHAWPSSACPGSQRQGTSR
jgi:hypothetical protein